MKLETALSRIPYGTNIRIFAGPQTIFHGNIATIHKKELNIKVRPYYDCMVNGPIVSNGTYVLTI